jgi:uncharacterized membrane protein YeiB
MQLLRCLSAACVVLLNVDMTHTHRHTQAHTIGTHNTYTQYIHTIHTHNTYTQYMHTIHTHITYTQYIHTLHTHNTYTHYIHTRFPALQHAAWPLSVCRLCASSKYVQRSTWPSAQPDGTTQRSSHSMVAP